MSLLSVLSFTGSYSSLPLPATTFTVTPSSGTIAASSRSIVG